MVLGDAGNEVTLWARRPDWPRRSTPSTATTTTSPTRPARAVRAVSDPDEAMAGRGIRRPRPAVPVPAAEPEPPGTSRPTLCCSAWPRGSSRYGLADERGDRPGRRDRGRAIAVVTGPNLAREIIERQPSASVVASASPATAVPCRRLVTPPVSRVHQQRRVGSELAGATKNVIALAVGMGVGLGFGGNATALVITRGLAETSRLGVAWGRTRSLPGWPDWVTWSPRAPRRCRATAPSARHSEWPDGRRDHRLHPAGRRGREVLASIHELSPGNRSRCRSWSRSPTSSVAGELTAAADDHRR